MRTPRSTPLTLEQAVLRCETCHETLAIVDALGDNTAVTYLWKPDPETDPPRCHGKGVTESQAVAAYKRDGCDEFFQSVIDSYTWVEREPVLDFEYADEAPEIHEDIPVVQQLAIEHA